MQRLKIHKGLDVRTQITPYAPPPPPPGVKKGFIKGEALFLLR